MRIINGDSLVELKTLPDNSIDSVVCDPPYGLSFMNKKWDYDVPTTELWKECFRVLKPGGHLLAFFGSRTYHRGAVRIEDAGFEIRDQLMWLYGSGFPKSHNIGKAQSKRGVDVTHEGWGTALKPAHEPIVMARKPFKGTVVDNVIKHGTGGINIDECRIEHNETLTGGFGNGAIGTGVTGTGESVAKDVEWKTSTEGRFPANVIHDGSDEVLEHFPHNNNVGHSPKTKVTGYGNKNVGTGSTDYKGVGDKHRDESTSTSRFFYCAKVSKKERNAGLEQDSTKNVRPIGQAFANGSSVHEERSGGNNHPTVKPIALMSYLVRLVTPKGGVVLDPFMGSGSTGLACKKEGFDFIGIELSEEYAEIAKRRIEAYEN